MSKQVTAVRELEIEALDFLWGWQIATDWSHSSLWQDWKFSSGLKTTVGAQDIARGSHDRGLLRAADDWRTVS
jgi:hypothetical protein